MNATLRSACVDVTIRTDNVYEGVEDFSLDLFFDNAEIGFFVIPNVTTVTISDTTGSFSVASFHNNLKLGHCRVDHWFHWSTLSSNGEHGTNDIHCWCDWRYNIVHRCGSVLLHNGWIHSRYRLSV